MFHKESQREALEARGYKAREAWRAEACWNSTVSTAKAKARLAYANKARRLNHA